MTKFKLQRTTEDRSTPLIKIVWYNLIAEIHGDAVKIVVGAALILGALGLGVLAIDSVYTTL